MKNFISTFIKTYFVSVVPWVFTVIPIFKNLLIEKDYNQVCFYILVSSLITIAIALFKYFKKLKDKIVKLENKCNELENNRNIINESYQSAVHEAERFKYAYNTAKISILNIVKTSKSKQLKEIVNEVFEQIESKEV